MPQAVISTWLKTGHLESRSFEGMNCWFILLEAGLILIVTVRLAPPHQVFL